MSLFCCDCSNFLSDLKVRRDSAKDKDTQGNRSKNLDHSSMTICVDRLLSTRSKVYPVFFPFSTSLRAKRTKAGSPTRTRRSLDESQSGQ